VENGVAVYDNGRDDRQEFRLQTYGN